MSAEELNLGVLDEGGASGKEVSEEEKKKVAEDGKRAQQAHKQVKDMQIKNTEFALFLSKVLKRYYNNELIITLLYELLHNLEENEEIIKIIFAPFVLENGFDKISDYVDYLKENRNKGNKELIFEVIEHEKLGGEALWHNLKNGKTEISYKDFKKQILDSLK